MANVFEKLFNKSEEELAEIEAEEAVAAQEETATPRGKLKPESTPLGDKVRSESEARMEKYRQELKAKKGIKPPAEVGAGLLKDTEFNGFVEEDIDPMFKHINRGVNASPKEEEQLKFVTKGLGESIYGKDTFPHIIRGLTSQGELYEGISMTAFHVLKREHGRLVENGEKPSPALFFSETGAIPIVIGQLWQVAQAAGLPGSDSSDQFVAATVDVFRRIGEELIEKGDEAAIGEAEDLLIDMALTNKDGTSMESDILASKGSPKKSELAASISSSLLSGE